MKKYRIKEVTHLGPDGETSHVYIIQRRFFFIWRDLIIDKWKYQYYDKDEALREFPTIKKIHSFGKQMNYIYPKE